ncbi:MAG: response regulator transcription factor [Chloroflexaceae bacterium]|nr:response regulator transcription factor [Chloroflexaceae bacterium]
MAKIRVALVEDHALTRVGLRTTLRQQSEFELVGEAASGTDGLLLLEQTLPDVAIVDIGLPGIDGIELTRQFRGFQQENNSSITKILILTLQDQEESVLAAFAAGADSYCMKDAHSLRLVEAIKVTLEGNSWIDPAIAKIVLSKATKFDGEERQRAATNRTVAIHATEPEYTQIIEAYPLTERELEVLQLIVDGFSNAEIADKLYITVGTVKTHVRNILNKLCADDRTQAAVRALRAGLIG